MPWKRFHGSSTESWGRLGARTGSAIEYEGTWSVPATAEQVGELRNQAHELLAAHGLDEQTLSDISVALSEAATNVVVHAYVDREPGEMELRVEVRHGAVVLTVSDRGRGMQPRADSPGLGIGIPLIGKLASSLDMRAGPDGIGTEVAMTFDVPGLVGRPSMRDEEGQVGLLSRIVALTESGSWPGAGYDRLTELLVPDLADACAIDILSEEGRPERLGARVAFDEELTEWLRGRTPVVREVKATIPDLRQGRPRVIRVDDGMLEQLAHDPSDRARMEELGLRYWIVLPLLADGETLGSFGLGLRPERGDPRGIMEFLRAAADRVARGIARERVTHNLRAAGGQYEEILRHLGAAVTVQDSSGRTVYANEAAVELLGATSAEEILSAAPGELAARFIITREDRSPVAFTDLPGTRLLHGKPASPLLTRSVSRATGREQWLLTRATVIDEGRGLIANIIEDVTEAKSEELRQRVLARAGELFVSPRAYIETMQSLAELVLPDLADWSAIDAVVDGELERVALAHADPEKRELVEQLRAYGPPRMDGGAAVGSVARSGEPQLHREVPDARLRETARSPEHLELLREMGLRSALVVPIVAGDETIAAMTLASAESRRSYDEGDLEFAQELARRAAAALAAARNRS